MFNKKLSLKNQFKFILSVSLLLFGTVKTSYALDTELAGKYYERAVKAYQTKQNAAAILELKSAIQQNPKYLAAHILLAEVYLNDSRLTLTEVALSQADKLSADPELLVMTRAQLYLYQLKFSQLLKEIVPARFSKNLQPDLYIYRGHAHLQLNELAYAQSEYKTAANLQPNRIEPIIGNANVLLRLNNIKGAIKAADKATKMHPDLAGGWNMKASTSHFQGLLQDALANYEHALKNDPQHQAARIARAGILIDLHRDTEAETDLTYLRENYPFDAKAAYLHAVILARTNRKEQANAALLSAAEILAGIQPKFLVKHPQTLMLAGLVNYSLKRSELAIRYLQAYIDKYPGQPGAYKLLGSLLLEKGQNEKVIQLLKPALANIPNDPRLQLILGTAYMQNGQHDQANALFEKVSKAGAKGSIQTEIGLNRLTMGQDDLAIKDLTHAFENNSKNRKAGIPLVIKYLSLRKSKKALEIANKMYLETPDNLTLLNLLGTTQVANKEYSQARSSFEKAINKKPEFLTAHINLSKLDFVVKKPDAAKQRLNNLITQYPENITLLIELARFHQLEDNNTIASDLLKKALKIDTKSLIAKLALIELKLKANRPAEALKLAQEAQKIDRTNIQVQEILARSFMANNNRGKASGVLQIMSQNAGFNAKRLVKIAQQQYAIADYSAAIKSLKKAVLGNKDYIPARVTLADIELQHGELIFAKNQADFLIKRYPRSPFGYRISGDVALRSRQKSQAIEHYQTAFSKDQSSYLLMKLYTALKQTGDNTQAYQLLEKWVTDHPQDLIPVQALAEEHLHAGRLKTAQKYYEQLIKQQGKQPNLLNNLAFIYFNTNDDRALSYAQQALELTPNSPSANDTLGWILVNKGQAEQGLHYLRTAFARASQDPEIRYHIAEALYKLQRFNEAKTELELALKYSTSFNGRDKAKQLLKKLSNQ